MKISTILDQIESGQMALPEFQRGYVWNRDQVKGLADSLYRQNPIGSLLVWETESATAKHRGDMVAPAGMVELLLDGQQRMTSLYGLIRGKAPAFFDGNSSTFTGLYFNMESEEFSFYMPTKMENDPLWINVSKLMIAGHTGVGDIAKKFAANPENLHIFYSRYSGRLSSLLNIKERELHIEKITGKEKTLSDIVDIFNRVNSGGTKLSTGDLALAKICASWPDARSEMKKILTNWADAGYNFDMDWLLRVMNADLTGEANFVHLHKRSLEEIKNSLNRTVKNIDYLLNLISGRLGLDHDRVLFGRYAFPVMARYLADKGGKLNDVQEQNKLLLWYLVGSLWGRYSNSTESVIGKDLSLIEDTEKALDKLIDEVRLWQGGLSIQPEHFKSWGRGSRFYPLLYLLTRTGEAKDFGTGIPLKMSLLGAHNSLEVHHIFPKSLLYEYGYRKEEVNSLANFCFLTKNTNNSIINNRKPAEYFKEVEELFPGVLESQWIPMDKSLWEIGNYRQFLNERRNLLAAAANNFIESLKPAGLEDIIVERPEELGAKPVNEFENKSPDEIMELIKEWLSSNNLPVGKEDYELVDTSNDGKSVLIFDVAWPNGLREGLDAPVGLALQAPPAALDEAKALGFETFTQPDKFKNYIMQMLLASPAGNTENKTQKEYQEV